MELLSKSQAVGSKVGAFNRKLSSSIAHILLRAPQHLHSVFQRVACLFYFIFNVAIGIRFYCMYVCPLVCVRLGVCVCVYTVCMP